MIICTNCNTQCKDGTKVCPTCGAKFVMTAQTQKKSGGVQDTSFDHTSEFVYTDISENRVYAMACYALSFVGILIASIAGNESP